jgi:hypothetical protein
MRGSKSIVFEIRVLDHNKIAGGFLNASAQCCSLAQIAWLQKHTHLWMLALQLGQDFTRSVT